MGSKIEYDDAFDSRFITEFKCGNLVSWKKLGETKSYGFIIQVYFEEMSTGRKFMFAKVRKPDGTQENFMLSSLTKES
jgi:hypothetical protein